MSSPLSESKMSSPLLNVNAHAVVRASHNTYRLYRDGLLIGGAYQKSTGYPRGWQTFIHAVGKRHSRFYDTLEEAVRVRWRPYPRIIELFLQAERGPILTRERFLTSGKSLAYHVECKWPHNEVFEPIAAFNAGAIAEAYAEECRKANGELTYRVIDYRGVIV